MNKEKIEQRANDFAKNGVLKSNVKETRAVLVSSGNIATPTQVEGINDTFNQVSSIVDLVKVVNCEGMGANKVAYLTAISQADVTNEGAAYNSSDPTYAYVTIQPQTVTVLSQVSKQVKKQTPLYYTAKVEDSAFKALRVKAANIITNAILKSSIIDTSSVSIAAINDTTLRDIAFAYGSEETIEGDAYLFLTKADLYAFGKVRGTNGNKSAVYEIIPDTSNPNIGVIKDGGLAVKYCLNPNLTALANAETGGVSMLYGQPQCCELDLFSDYEIKVSEDYSFNTGMLTVRGDVELGADVVKLNGFVGVTKAA